MDCIPRAAPAGFHPQLQVHTWFRRTCWLYAVGILFYYSIVFGIDIYNAVASKHINDTWHC